MPADALFQTPDDWKEFQSYVRDKSRYVLTEKHQHFIDALVATSEKRALTVKKGTRMVRARVGTNSQNGVKRPLSYEEMMAPPRAKATEGRLNPRGIPYLYLANNKETAIAEVRPWGRAYVSVAFCELLRAQRLIDLTKDFPRDGRSSAAVENQSPEAIERKIWRSINQSFSVPISPDDKFSEYVYTQYITEIFKASGFDGVRYKSSLYEGGYNYLLFHPDVVKFIKAFVFKMEDVRYKFRRVASHGPRGGRHRGRR